MAAMSRLDHPTDTDHYTPSRWIALSRDGGVLKALSRISADAPWAPLDERAARSWTDDHASILPFVRWDRMTGQP
jgi:hypothetical protein